MSTQKITAIRRRPVTPQAAVDAFLSSPRCENANTCRAYATVLEKVAAQLDPACELADVDDSEISQTLHELWDDAAPSTWNRNRAAVGSWLSWCQTTKCWPAPALPSDCERRAEHADRTHDLPKRSIDRQLSRRDIPLREKTLWRMLYETAARASEILALDVEQLDLANRRAPVRSKGGETEWLHWGTGTAHLLPRLLRLPDGTSRTSGPLFLANESQRPLVSHRRAISARTPAGPGSDTTAPVSSCTATRVGDCTSSGTPPPPTSARRKSRCS